MRIKARRVGPGYYEVLTPHGTYRVENTPCPKGSGYGSGPNWLIFGPSQSVADTARPTKREALEYISRMTLPTLEDVTLPSDEWDREQARLEALTN